MSLVNDASAAVTALVREDATGQWAANLMDGEDLHVPRIFLAEGASVIRLMESSGKLSSGDATQAYDDLLNLDIEQFDYEPFGIRIWELRHNVTPYDAWYVAIAETLKVPLLTLDGRLANAPGSRCEFLVPPSVAR